MFERDTLSLRRRLRCEVSGLTHFYWCSWPVIMCLCVGLSSLFPLRPFSFLLQLGSQPEIQGSRFAGCQSQLVQRQSLRRKEREWVSKSVCKWVHYVIQWVYETIMQAARKCVCNSSHWHQFAFCASALQLHSVWCRRKIHGEGPEQCLYPWLCWRPLRDGISPSLPIVAAWFCLYYLLFAF